MQQIHDKIVDKFVRKTQKVWKLGQSAGATPNYNKQGSRTNTSTDAYAMQCSAMANEYLQNSDIRHN